MSDGKCAPVPMFSRNEVLTYLDKKIADYRQWEVDAHTDGNATFERVFHVKRLSAETIREDIAAMGVQDVAGVSSGEVARAAAVAHADRASYADHRGGGFPYQ